MKDILPLAVTQGTAGRELSAAAGIKAGVNTGQTATDSASSVDSTADKASFLDSLQHLLSSNSTQDAAPALVSKGGKDLPLAEQTAASIPPGLMSTPTDMREQQDAALLIGAPQGAIIPTTESTAASSTAAASSGLSTSVLSTSAQSKLPAQAGPVPVDVSVEDVALQVSDRARVSARDMDLPLTLQSQQALNKADASISSSSSLVRMQLAPLDSSQQLNPIDKELTVKAGLMPQLNTRETAEPQLTLKAGSVLAEPEQLMTTRMQLSAFNQAGEPGGLKLTLDSTLTQTQPAATDSLNASLSRSPVLQTALSAESLTTTSSQSVISETFGKADWGQGMGKQILWMVNQNISSAEFRLNPANLGPLEVRINMDNDQVNVAFSSRHADVRDAVEQALPKLREMFEDKGLSLSDADVSQHSFAEQRENAFEQAAEGEASGQSFTAENDHMADQGHQDMDAVGISSMLNEGLVDYYI